MRLLSVCMVDAAAAARVVECEASEYIMLEEVREEEMTGHLMCMKESMMLTFMEGWFSVRRLERLGKLFESRFRRDLCGGIDMDGSLSVGG